MVSNLYSLWEALWPFLIMLSLIISSFCLGYYIAKGIKPVDDESEYEHKFFIFRYGRIIESEKELTELEHAGWSIESYAGSDSYRAFFILKREIPKSNNDE